MLTSLRLRDFVLVEEQEVLFGPGLNVVTGETGTGKSILIDAIGFIAGGRADADWIRREAETLEVEARFDVALLPGAAEVAARLGHPADRDGLTIRRELSRSGKSRATLQGRPARVADLKALGAALLDLHAQGEHRRLLDPAEQLELLDRFAGAMPERSAYVAAREAYRRFIAEHASMRERLADLLEKEEWHRFQLQEIEAAALSIEEEQSLRAAREEAERVRKDAEVRDLVERILFEEEGSALDRIETAQHRVAALGADWEPVRRAVEDARGALRTARRALPAAVAGGGDEEIDRIEERLAALAKVQRKYGGSLEAVQARRDALAALLEETDNLRIRSEGADEARSRLVRVVAEAGLRLRRARHAAARDLGEAVTAEIRDLGMGGAVLDVVLEEEVDEGPDGIPVETRRVVAQADGIDVGWYRLRPNPGEGAGMLAAVASGGELSRVLLALLVVLGEKEEPRTAIFDEVDAGVGGAAAAAVARRLELLGRGRQVLLVTHLPLIACRAARHLRVVKGTARGRTVARVQALDREERIGELARMLAGEMDSAIARQHAEAMMTRASNGEDDR